MEHVTESCRNVFLDIGFEPGEAQRLLLQCELTLAVQRLFGKRRLTRAKAAKLFGVNQPRISDLTRGKISRFDIDTLIAMLGRAGVEIGLTFKHGKAA